MARARSMHKLAEVLWEMLDEEGYWDDDAPRERSRRSRSPRTSTRRGMVRSTARRAYIRTRSNKKKRKVSRYQRAFGACLKELKKKHPRTAANKLMGKAHRCARAKRKREGW